MARWRTGRGSCKVGVEPHDTNRADEEAPDLSTSRADVDPPKPATAQCVAGIEASICNAGIRTDRHDEEKHRRVSRVARLVPL
jgi:hypothetical protein